MQLWTSFLFSKNHILFSITYLFSFLFPKNLISYKDAELLQKATALQQLYKNDISESFPMQLLLFVTTLRSEIEKLQTIKEMATLAIVKHLDLGPSFTEVWSVLMLFLTIPVTVASAQRSFSKLKFIKKYLRNSMSQERLADLAILNIEAAEAKSINVQEIIDDFAQMKCRKKTF